MIGRNMNMRAWTGSTGCGFNFCCRNSVTPIMSGQAPIARNSGGVNGISPNRLAKEVGSGADKSWIQPKNGACRISIDEQDLVKREEHRNLDHDRQAAGERVGADLLVKRHGFLL